jgi:starch-binding outer membrane protein, SusD/RagB family
MKRMRILFLAVFLGTVTSCQDQLDISNPNEPTTETLKDEKGFLKFAMGGVYINGFVDIKTTAFADGVLGAFWANGFHDIMADNLGAEAANCYMNQIGAPEYVQLDNGTVVQNPNSPKQQPDMLTQNNLNATAGQNPLFYEWAYMYALNRVSNYILLNVDGVTFTGDAATKIATLKAWAYWWKGFAYSRIGSLYYAGLIVDDPLGTNANYKTSAEILAEAENNFAQATTILNGLTAYATYTEVMSRIIPDFNQVGHGGVPSPDEWIRNINTYRARNILANKTVAAMLPADWDQINTLTVEGIRANDIVFTCRSNENGDILSPQAGTVAAKATGDPTAGATYKISERLIQAFQPGDQRMANNFAQLGSPWLGNADRGNIFNTRWELLDGGNGMAGVVTYSDRTPGGEELFMAGSFEENELMHAEALIYRNNIAAALPLIDAVRARQGAGLPALTGQTLTQAQAIAQLRSERRVALLFRNVAFYDARRYRVIDPITAGGGLTGAVVIDGTGTLNTNATINYNFLDYWHVPDNELAYNAPSDDAAPVFNPKAN